MYHKLKKDRKNKVAIEYFIHSSKGPGKLFTPKLTTSENIILFKKRKEHSEGKFPMVPGGSHRFTSKMEINILHTLFFNRISI